MGEGEQLGMIDDAGLEKSLRHHIDVLSFHVANDYRNQNHCGDNYCSNYLAFQKTD